jgi:hypothetical protein
VAGVELETELLSLDEEDVVTGLPGVLDELGTDEDSTGVEDGVGELGTTELEDAQVVTGLLEELLGVEEVRTGLVTVDGGTISDVDVTISVVLGTVEVSTGLLEYGVDDDATGDDDVMTGLLSVAGTDEEDMTGLGGRAV